LTFKELLTKQRMLHAEDLIKKSNQSLHEIATKVGFTSYNGFISAYEKHFGKHPKK
jgi:YesN/AraC family two-component response regulator